MPREMTREGVEANRVQQNLASLAIYHTTCDRKVLKALLLMGDTVSCRGELRQIRSKHIGAGVYRVWSEPT